MLLVGHLVCSVRGVQIFLGLVDCHEVKCQQLPFQVMVDLVVDSVLLRCFLVLFQLPQFKDHALHNKC
jgi:hypothetical protein